MATVNDVCSLAATLSDLCDDTDTNLLYILSVAKLYCKCVANKYELHSTRYGCWHLCKRTTCHVTKAVGIELSFDP